MKNLYSYLLRIGLAVTFIGVGIYILKDPVGWGMMIQPWALKLMPGSLSSMMISTGILDIVVGVFLLFNIMTWLAALVASVHLLIVLVTVGITSITIRDVGLLFCAVGLTVETLPSWITKKLKLY